MPILGALVSGAVLKWVVYAGVFMLTSHYILNNEIVALAFASIMAVVIGGAIGFTHYDLAKKNNNNYSKAKMDKQAVFTHIMGAVFCCLAAIGLFLNFPWESL